MDCSLLGSSVHGVFQVKTLEGVATKAADKCSLQDPLLGLDGPLQAGLPSALGQQKLNSDYGRELVMDREAWHAVIHRVAKSWTRLSD